MQCALNNFWVRYENTKAHSYPLTTMNCLVEMEWLRLFLPYKIDLRDQVQKKIDKILEPPPVKSAKPLPRPDDAPRKKRGGRRYSIEYLIL